MTTCELLADLGNRGVVFEVDEGSLRVTAPTGLLTDSDRAALRENKAAIIAELTRPQALAIGDQVRQVDGEGYSLRRPGATITAIVWSESMQADAYQLDGRSWTSREYLRSVLSRQAQGA